MASVAGSGSVQTPMALVEMQLAGLMAIDLTNVIIGVAFCRHGPLLRLLVCSACSGGKGGV